MYLNRCQGKKTGSRMLPRMKMQAQKTRRSLLDVRRSAAPRKAFDSTASTSMVFSGSAEILPQVQIEMALTVANRISENSNIRR